jgi:hypothetical protein
MRGGVQPLPSDQAKRYQSKFQANTGASLHNKGATVDPPSLHLDSLLQVLPAKPQKTLSLNLCGVVRPLYNRLLFALRRPQYVHGWCDFRSLPRDWYSWSVFAAWPALGRVSPKIEEPVLLLVPKKSRATTKDEDDW